MSAITAKLACLFHISSVYLRLDFLVVGNTFQWRDGTNFSDVAVQLYSIIFREADARALEYYYAYM